MTITIDSTTLDWQMIAAVFAGLTVIVALLAWRWPRRRNSPVNDALPLNLHGNVVTQCPTVHATSGVPSLAQLTEGIKLDAKRAFGAQRLYDVGLRQFNHYINNLDGVIADARAEKGKLKPLLSPLELSLSESVGLALATARGEELQLVKARYNALSLPSQSYAEHQRREQHAQQFIANALRHNVSRTDYTAVKSRISSGDYSLAAILTELPIYWQDLRTLDQEIKYQEPKEKPPKREFYHVLFVTSDAGLLEDKRAERDGDWIISEKHGMTAPYQEPVEILQYKNPDEPPVRTGKSMIVIDKELGSEWETEAWRQGGYGDQVYQRAKFGLLPHQLRRSYRRRLISRTSWMVSGIMLIIYSALLAFNYL